jgi:ABC-2 type transport system ATP-binding protein
MNTGLEYVIQVENLTHSYGDRMALDNISFNIERGEVFALLGPNGAGKTTTIRLLNGLFPPSGGRMRVLSLDPHTQGDLLRRHSGVLTETPALYERLTAIENLQFFGTLAGMSSGVLQNRIAELMDFFDLSQRSNERVGNYSKGMKQRLALARTLLHNPQLVYLDEPTSGLDPESAQQVHELMHSIRQKNGQTIMLSTHHLYEAERLCDRVAILNRGRLLACGTLGDLRQQFFPGEWVIFDFLIPPSQDLLLALKANPGVLMVNHLSPESIKVQISANNIIPSLISSLVALDAQILAVKPYTVSLEEIYFKLQQESSQ